MSQPIVAPISGGGGGGVQSITVGNNMTLTGTAANPIITGAVITAGTSIEITGAPNNITISSTGSGPSSANIPVPSSTPGTPPQKDVSAGTQVQFYTIADTFLPQAVGGKNCYRFTFSGTLGPEGTTVGTGYISIVARLYTTATNTFKVIGAQTLRVEPVVGGIVNNMYWSFSSIFVPQPDDVVQVWVYNNTDTLLTLIDVLPLEGCGIELVSTDNAGTLIFS